MLSSPFIFTFASTKPLIPANFLVHDANLRLRRHYISFLPPKSYASDEFPVDETFLERFAPKDKESEDEARIKNWKLRGWAPWEEVLSYEADFARKSLDEGEEVPLQTPEAIEAFRMLSQKYRQEKMEESGLTEDEVFRKRFDVKGEIPKTLQTYWTAPVVATHLPPRDWPPRGWQVDRKELEFIRESHKSFTSTRINLDDLNDDTEEDDGNLDRYKAFLKQYHEWVEHNQDRLEEESFEDDQDYYPGRRKRGKDYKEGMFELPFYYPGQICEGKVTCIALHQGAFIDVGGVHDGWVPIKGNDWYWIRHHIRVGMHVLVEILAKRDPYRFRFPLEMRFVFPNIDHLIFNKFEYPPIFRRFPDANLDELRRDCGRPPVPKLEPLTKPEEEPLLSNHPYVDTLWKIHVAEQMIIDDVELNPEKYAGKILSELSDDEDFDEENAIEFTEAQYKSGLVPKVILKTSVKELDLESAYQERQYHKEKREEAIKRGEKYKIEKLKRNEEMDEFDCVHWRRSLEEREALMRDISCRQAHGLPLEEPGKFKPKSFFGKDQYDPENPLYRYDYWGEPKNSEKSRQERMTDAHNKSIVGKGTVWYEMSYEDTIRQRVMRESMDKAASREESDVSGSDDDDDDFDFSLLNGIGVASQPHVNGTESLALFDDENAET